MGYTHYYCHDRSKIEDKDHQERFNRFSEICRKIFVKADELWIALASANGFGKPIVDWSGVYFNGSIKQPKWRWTSEWTPNNLQWPDSSVNLTNDQIAQVKDKWFAGLCPTFQVVPNPKNEAMVDASYEAFVLRRIDQPIDQLDDNGYYFGFTKTNFYPYDIAVTAVLIALYNIYKDTECVRISSDGEKKDRVPWYNLLRDATGDNGWDLQFTS